MTRRGLLALAAFVAALLCAELVARLQPAGQEASARTLLVAILATHASLGLAGLALAVFVPGGDPVARLGLRPGRMGRGGMVWAAVGVVALSHALHRILATLELRDRGTLGRIDRVVESAAQDVLGVALVALALVALAPLIEEMLFRGLLLRALRQRLGASLAVGLSAAGFGLFHMDLYQGGAALVLGLYLGAVALRAGSARPAMVCHVANNGFGVVSAAIGLQSSRGGVTLVLVLLGVSGVALWKAWRGVAEPPSPPPTRPGMQAPEE